MILGMSLSTFVSLHVVLSLIGLVTGAAVLLRMIVSRRLASVTTLFLVTTAATSVTGFLFPLTRIGLGQVTGALSLAVLVPTVLALYGYRLAGPWRPVYAAGATAALWLNAVIGVAQAFAKLDVLRPLAATTSALSDALPYLATQFATLALFAGLGLLAVRRFRPCPPAPVRIRWPAAPV